MSFNLIVQVTHSVVGSWTIKSSKSTVSKRLIVFVLEGTIASVLPCSWTGQRLLLKSL